MTSQPRITSRQNPRVKDAARLRIGRERRRCGRFLIDGVRETTRALAAGIRPLEAFVCDSQTGSREAGELAQALQQAGAELLYVSDDVFEKLCFGERDEGGMVVVAESPVRRLSDLCISPDAFVAVVEGVEKPGNLGAILRSADAVGVDAVIVADSQTDLFNPNAIRASLGTVFQPNVVAVSTVDAIVWLQEHNLRILTARPDAKTLYTDADLRGPLAVVVGSESAGLSSAWQTAEVQAVRLPMHGLADSLNVSTAAAVLFYEALRQRT